MPFFSFSRPLVWVLLAGLGFLFLPVQALDYGLFHSTPAERWAAMGWVDLNISWFWFLPLLLFLLPKQTACSVRLNSELIGIAALLLFILASATLSNIGLGYAVVPLVIALIGLATNNLAQLNVMRGDRFILAALISILALIVIFIVYPIVVMLISLFVHEGEIEWWQAWKILQQPYIQRIVGNSLLIAFCVGISSTLLGLALALYTTRVATNSRFIGRLLSILPMVTPPFVVGLGITLMLGRSGYLTQFLATHFDITHNWLYGFYGIVIAHTLALTPMAFMIIEGALKSASAVLEEASYTLGAKRSQTFIHITLPLLRPALANAFLVVAIQSLADFGTPLVLGGNFDVIATQIYFAIAGAQLDYPLAGTLGSLLLLFSLLIFLLQYYWVGKHRYTTIVGKGSHQHILPLSSGLKWLIIFILYGWGLFTLMLYGSIFYGSFTVNWGVDHQLTLANYIRLFGQGMSDGGFPSLIQTVIFAALSAPITACFGLMMAYILVRYEFKHKKSLEFLTLLCFAVPGTVAGVSYLLAFNSAPLYLTGTGAIIVLSMIMRNMPIGMRAAIAGLKQLDRSLDEASLALQANTFQTFRYVILPLLKPALLSALVTSFVRAMTTVSAIIFLVNAETRVATAYILNRVEDGEYGIAVAYGTILIVVMMAIILLFEQLVGENRLTKSSSAGK